MAFNPTGSLWFLFAQFLKTRVIPERIEHRIEPEQRRRKRHARGETAIAWY